MPKVVLQILNVEKSLEMLVDRADEVANLLAEELIPGVSRIEACLYSKCHQYRRGSECGEGEIIDPWENEPSTTDAGDSGSEASVAGDTASSTSGGGTGGVVEAPATSGSTATAGGTVTTPSAPTSTTPSLVDSEGNPCADEDMDMCFSPESEEVLRAQGDEEASPARGVAASSGASVSVEGDDSAEADVPVGDTSDPETALAAAGAPTDPVPADAATLGEGSPTPTTPAPTGSETAASVDSSESPSADTPTVAGGGNPPTAASSGEGTGTEGDEEGEATSDVQAAADKAIEEDEGPGNCDVQVEYFEPKEIAQFCMGAIRFALTGSAGEYELDESSGVVANNLSQI